MFSRRIINPQDLPDWIPKSKDSDPKFSGGLKKGAETWSENGLAQGCKSNSLTESDLLKGHVYASSWPSIFIGGYADHVRIVRVSPIESEKVKISAEWLFEKKTLKNKNYNKENVISFACKIMEQDAKACELNQKGIKTREDLAELSVEELTDVIEMDEKTAADLIMEAREHWFKEDE